MRLSKLHWMLAASLAWVMATGCGGNDDPINQVQPNALNKEMFVNSEWYAHATTIDTDYHSSDFVGDANTMQRVRWEIQEDMLIARRSYEYQRDQEGESLSGADATQNAVVAMYSIDSHFDIRRAYNPVTGEEQNVIVENSTDRPWYEREYMRVDWSMNHVPDPMMRVSAESGLIIEPLGYFVQEDGDNGSHDYWKPTFARDENGEVNYFDVVNKYFTRPGLTQAQDQNGNTLTLPTCLLVFGIANGKDDCSPGEISVRWSFLRVEDNDYEPLIYTSDRMDRFGYFLTHRDGYNRYQGLPRFERIRFANRHNMWQRSHQMYSVADAIANDSTVANDAAQAAGLITSDELFACGDRNEDKCSVCNTDDAGNATECLVTCVTDAQCGATLGNGSYCDTAYGLAHETAGACTIPFRDREVRPIPYHLSENFPEEFISDMQDMVDGWDSAFRGTVASLRRIECEKNGGSDCGQFTPENTPEVYVMCHNPVIEGDNAACGEEGTVARVGDLRYKQILWVHEPHAASPLGYGPSFSDPYTGELIGAAANVYGAPLDIYAGQARDILAAINGDLTVENIQSNASYLTWIQDVQRRTFETSEREAHNHIIELDGFDAEESNNNMDFSYFTDRMPQFTGDATPENFHARFEAAQQAAQLIAEEGAWGQKGRARESVLRDTQIEQLLINEERKLGAGYMPGQPLQDMDMDRVSPVRNGGLRGIKQLNWIRRQRDAKQQHCVLSQEFADDGLAGLVQEIDRAVNEGDGTVTWYGKSYPVGTRETGIDYDMVREMIRHPIFHAVMAHEVGHTLGLRHNFQGSYDALNYKPEYWKLRSESMPMRPRAYDPETPAETAGRIREYQYSTVMDYGHNFIVTDPHGVGYYDKAAIKAGYGDLAQVFTEVLNQANALKIAQMAATVNAGVLHNLDPASASGIRAMPYTEWPQLVGGVDAMQARKDVAYSDLDIVDNPLLGGGSRSMTAAGEPVVPYMYCGDEYSNFQPNCLAYDAGADPYETLQSVIDSYWDYYPFSHFQRQRLSFNNEAVRFRSQSRYLSKLESATRIYSLYRVLLGAALGGDAFFLSEDGWGPYTVGVDSAYALLRRIVTTPEPGSHLQTTLTDGTTVYEQGFAANIFDLGSSFEVDSFDGRYLRTGFDFGPDFTWLFFDRAGWFHDKDLAIETLVYSDVEFLAQDTTTDVREFSTNFYTVFSKSLGPFLGGIISQDWKAYAPYLDQNGDMQYLAPSQIEKRGLNMTNRSAVLDPNVAFSLELVTMSKGAAWIQRAFDQGFMNKFRVFLAGGDEAVDLGENTVSFTDEESGLTYIAATYPDDSIEGMEGTTIETGIGAAMIQRAKDLKEAGRDAELADWIDNLNLARALTGWYGGGASEEGIRSGL